MVKDGSQADAFAGRHNRAACRLMYNKAKQEQIVVTAQQSENEIRKKDAVRAQGRLDICKVLANR
jgi:hypothetical protein